MEEEDKLLARKNEVKKDIKIVSEIIKREILEKEKELNKLNEELMLINEN